MPKLHYTNISKEVVQVTHVIDGKYVNTKIPTSFKNYENKKHWEIVDYDRMLDKLDVEFLRLASKNRKTNLTHKEAARRLYVKVIGKILKMIVNDIIETNTKVFFLGRKKYCMFIGNMPFNKRWKSVYLENMWGGCETIFSMKVQFPFLKGKFKANLYMSDHLKQKLKQYIDSGMRYFIDVKNEK